MVKTWIHGIALDSGYRLGDMVREGFMVNYWIAGDLLNYGQTFELLVNFFIMSEIGFFPTWNWISSNVKLDFFQCRIRYLKIWHWISSNVKWDFFICDITFLAIWNLISLKVKFVFFQCEIGFLPIKNLLLFIWNWSLTHGIDFDSWYKLRIKALAKGKNKDRPKVKRPRPKAKKAMILHIVP